MADRIVKVVLRGDVAGLKSSMAAASKSVADAADKMTSADKQSRKFREGLTSVGDTAGKIGLVAAAGLGAVVLATANFDQSMSKVKAATHETAANMDLLRAAAIKAGADTAFSATEAADGIENLAKAGVSTGDILAGGLTGALDLAAAGSMGVGDAAEVAATALTQFKLQGKDVPHVADLLAAAAGKAQGEVSDMGMALKQGGLVAAQMGLSIEETTGTLSAFASAGLLGSDAGTSLKTMLLKLANPSAEAAKTMQALGINAYDASGNLVSMSDLAGQLQVAFQGQSQSTRDAAMATIFGSDAIRAASILYSQGAAGIDDWTSKVNDQGYAAETAATKLDNLKGDLEAFKGSLETALIGSGEGSQGALRSMTQGATDAVNVFNKLPAPIKNTGVAMLGLTAVMGGGAWFGAKAIGAVAQMRAGLVSLGLAADGAKLSIAGVATGAGVLAGLTFTGLGTLDMMDSAKRTREAADATAKSFTELQAVLQNSNVGKYASDLGIDIDKLAQDLAVYGEKGQYATQVQDMLAASGHGLGAMFKSLPGTVIPGFTTGTEKAADANNDLFHILENNKGALGQGAAAMDGAAGAADGMAGSAAGAADGLDAVGAAATGASAEVYTLQNAMDILFGKVDVDAAMVAWRRGLAGLSKELKGGADAFNSFTKQGQDNRDAVRGQVQSLRTWAEAQYNVDGSTKKLTQRLMNGREAIIAQAKAAHIGKDQTEKYLKALGLTPKDIRTDVKLLGTQKANGDIDGVQANLTALGKMTANPTMKARDQASAAIAAVRAGLASLHDKTIQIRAIHTDTRLGPIKQANGSVMDFFANGAENHVAQIAPAGAWRVWAEPETGGEAYIPLAASKRDRSLDIWRAVGDRLGVQFAEYATGGVNADHKTVNHFTPSELKSAINGLSITVDMDTKQVGEQLKQFKNDLRDAGGHWTKGLSAMGAKMLTTTKALEEQRKALDEAKQALSDLRQEAGQYRSSVAGNFLNDPFNQTVAIGTEDNQVSGLGALNVKLIEDQVHAKQMLAAAKTLTKEGFGHSALFKDLIASGDVQTAQELAALSKAQAKQYVQSYAERAQAASAVASYASQAVYAQQIAAQVTESKHLHAAVDTLTHQAKAQTQALLTMAKHLPTETGKAVASSLKNAAASSQQSTKNKPRSH